VILPEFFFIEAEISLFSTHIAADRTFKSLISKNTGRYVQLFTEVEKSCEEFPQKQVPAGHEHFSTWYFIPHSSAWLIHMAFDCRNSWEIFFVFDVKHL